jgi:hypothetical protein
MFAVVGAGSINSASAQGRGDFDRAIRQLWNLGDWDDDWDDDGWYGDNWDRRWRGDDDWYDDGWYADDGWYGDGWYRDGNGRWRNNGGRYYDDWGNQYQPMPGRSNSDGRYYVDPRGRNVRIDPGMPVGQQMLEFDHRALRNVGRTAAADFDGWLSQVPAGEVWRNHFELPALHETFASNRGTAPTVEERDSTRRIVGVFDEALRRTDLRSITSRNSFRTLHAVVQEFASPPEQRLLRQLSSSARVLHRSLGAFGTGATWQRYLAMPDRIVAAADRLPGQEIDREQFNQEELSKIVERYERVARSPEYRGIAALPEFQTTHERLLEFVDVLGGTAASTTAAEPEELTPPTPPPPPNSNPDEAAGDY